MTTRPSKLSDANTHASATLHTQRYTESSCSSYLAITSSFSTGNLQTVGGGGGINHTLRGHNFTNKSNHHSVALDKAYHKVCSDKVLGRDFGIVQSLNNLGTMHTYLSAGSSSSSSACRGSEAMEAILVSTTRLSELPDNTS